MHDAYTAVVFGMIKIGMYISYSYLFIYMLYPAHSNMYLDYKVYPD